MDLAKVVCTATHIPMERRHELVARAGAASAAPGQRLHVVAYDFGIKRNILRLLADHGCRMTVVPAQTSADDVHGAATRTACSCRTAPAIRSPARTRSRRSREFLDEGMPDVRHLPRSPAARARESARSTLKMKFGHHGANHPVLDLETGRVLHHEPEPRFRGRRGDAAGERRAPRTGRCSTARCRASPAPIAPPSASRVTPRRARARATWRRCSRSSSNRCCARASLPDAQAVLSRHACRSAPTSRAS